MNKKLMMMGLMALMVSGVNASCGGGSVCDKAAAAVTLSAEETTFVAKLGETQAKAFNLMSGEQRHEALAIAQKDGVTPDMAVDVVLSKHHLTLVDGALKASDVR